MKNNKIIKELKKYLKEQKGQYRKLYKEDPIEDAKLDRECVRILIQVENKIKKLEEK